MKIIKEEEEKTNEYILQKNTKTKVAITFILIILVLLILGIIVSALFFEVE
ncbi:hypothetical protein [Abyssalbus ytuae]|uniref:Uncharacterized protein n=1 Tax=Abyssalbus ytuae TaxID=2926907 RepID=A0A9E6ZWZ8_9FLAO|nr:hypothetical protein [Abyssalbus ytuae]UOB16717.1 hypothetical protein MQE35_13340 [Abyssalbus ytuae]